MKRVTRIYSIIKDQCLFSQFSAKFTKRVSVIYFEGNDLFPNSQSGFRKGDYYVSQLLFITHEIFKDFDAYLSLDTCGIFLDVSKVFDRVWHEVLIFKLQSYGISDTLLCLFNSFLSERLLRMVLSVQSSEWREV